MRRPGFHRRKTAGLPLGKPTYVLARLSALTLTNDRELQERVWDTAPIYSRSGHNLRRMITETEVNISHSPLAKFVGIKAYEKAVDNLLSQVPNANTVDRLVKIGNRIEDNVDKVSNAVSTGTDITCHCRLSVRCIRASNTIKVIHTHDGGIHRIVDITRPLPTELYFPNGSTDHFAEPGS